MESLTIPLRMRFVSHGTFSLLMVAPRPENPMLRITDDSVRIEAAVRI
jgi:hypothetical protein